LGLFFTRRIQLNITKIKLNKGEAKLETKICGKCKEEKYIDEFSKNSVGKDGLQCYCKQCQSIIAKEWKNNNREHVNALARQWNAKNPEKCRAKEKRWKDNHKEQYDSRVKRWRETNSDKIKEYSQQYRQENAEKIKETAKNRILADPLKYLLSERIYYAKKNDIIYGSVEELYNDLQLVYSKGKCECCGKEIIHNIGNGSLNNHSCSLDRIIPEKGYVIGNVAIICMECNRHKNNMSLETMKQMIVYMESKISISQNNQTSLEQEQLSFESVVNQ
jgi:hypothetical protein